MLLGVVVTKANANDGCQTEDVLQALVLLAKQGGCFVSRVWASNVADQRTACVWV